MIIHVSTVACGPCFITAGVRGGGVRSQVVPSRAQRRSRVAGTDRTSVLVDQARGGTGCSSRTLSPSRGQGLGLESTRGGRGGHARTTAPSCLHPPARLVSTGDAAKELGIHRETLRAWWRAGMVTPAEETVGGHARWDVDQLRRDIRALRHKD
ncbi:MerR family transcriptional regulator [Actinokineospora globicatena]|uniref:MerR family transcriptional regulator n=1 Tax=Actinokineospora globicatena TaxID=103729 RepID=UPI0025547CF0|nr:MerR family transcriptional regulator [Actinokineospora globicatena]